MALPAEKEVFSFADYLSWEESDHMELLDGAPIMMAPPSRMHQKISVELTRQLANFLDGRKCEVYAAPFAVRLFAQTEDSPEDVQTVLQPDISVVCDQEKLDKYGCRGAPDVVMEILSPSTIRHDRFIKFNAYQRAGVREYWIVSPQEQMVQVFLRKDTLLLPHEVYESGDIAKVNTLDGCFIELAKVFAV